MERNELRDKALLILTRVLSDRQTLEETLEDFFSTGDYQAQDKAWLQEVCSGTLRYKTRLELIIDSIALKKKPSGGLRKALLVATYQILNQEKVEPAWIVSETVNQIKKKEGQAPAKFANALLRRVADHVKEWRELPLNPKAKENEIANWACLPFWMYKRLAKSHGQEWVLAFAQASLERPVTWIRAKDPTVAQSFGEPGPVAQSYRVIEKGAIPERVGFKEGQFFVQDISGQLLVSEIFKIVAAECGEGFSALDLCSAPGGKAMGLSWSGARVTATDKDERRFKMLRENIKRAAPSVEIIPKNQLPGLPAQNLVWVDAPCTGTGIIRRHPDVRWLRKEDDIAKLNLTQKKLCEEGWVKVKRGGFLAYTVCSVLAEEGPALIDKIVPSLEGATVVKKWFLVPQEMPFGDGFWGALIQKSV